MDQKKGFCKYYPLLLKDIIAIMPSSTTTNKAKSLLSQPPALSTDVEDLVRALSQIDPISKPVAAFFSEHITPLSLPRKKLLLKVGTICRHVYFIRKGALRAFMKDGNKEITTWITVENELVTSISGLNIQQPSKEFIQALEPCELLVMSYDDLEKLYELHPEFNIIIRKLLQRYYHDAENRAFISRIPKADQRYRHFLETQPHLANRIPLRYIASYLGLALETLSRVRRKISSNEV